MLTTGGTMNVRSNPRKEWSKKKMSNRKNKNKLGQLSTKKNKS